MLNISEHWLNDPEFVNALTASGPLGVGIIQELTKAHASLADLENSRSSASTTLQTLIELATTLDAVHDRKARAVNHHLRGLIEGTDDPAQRREYRELEALLFPDGLRVVNLPHIEEGGAAVALERAVSPEIRAKLAAIQVGGQNLDDLLSAWITAGRKLGQAVQKRAELKASLGRAGSAVAQVDIRAGRARWLKTIRGLLWVIDHDDLRELEERVRAILTETINARLRSRDSGEALDGSESEELDDLEDEEVEDDEDENEDEDEEDDNSKEVEDLVNADV